MDRFNVNFAICAGPSFSILVFCTGTNNHLIKPLFLFQESIPEDRPVVPVEEDTIQRETIQEEHAAPPDDEHNVATFLDEVKEATEKTAEIQEMFQSAEMNGGAFDNLSNQEDMLKVCCTRKT